MKQLSIVGASGHGKVVADLAELFGLKVQSSEGVSWGQFDLFIGINALNLVACEVL